MIKVMVVEDEPPILQSICKILEGHCDVYQVVYKAINGQRAAQYLKENPVDLIFSDIKMPLMDGLELAKHVYENYPMVTLVLISGFQEFEFARTAMKYGVKDYLLKPITPQRMSEVLNNIMQEVDVLSKGEARNILRRLVLGEKPNLMRLPNKKYGVLLCCEGAFPVSADELPSDCIGFKKPNIVEFELLAQQDKSGEGFVVEGRSTSEKVLVFTAKTDLQVQNMAENMLSFLTRGQAVAVSIVKSEGGLSAVQLAETMAELRRKLYRNVCLFHSAIIDEKSLKQPDKEQFSAWKMNMILAMKTKNENNILQEVKKLSLFLESQAVRQTQVMMLLEGVLIKCLQSTLTMQQTEDLKQEIRAAISRVQTPEIFAQDLAEIAFVWAQNDGEQNEHEQAEFAQGVAQYLKENYKKAISNQNLANHFKCPSAQLSKKFKECFKMSLSEYINGFRVELAKEMMKENAKTPIKEIAVDIGFSDQYYFSKTFKKMCGVWPTEYLKQQGEL